MSAFHPRFHIAGFFVLMLLSVSCKSTFQVVEATRQPFAGGAAGSGSGNHYSVTIQSKTNSGVKIEGIYKGDAKSGKFFPARIQPAGSKIFIGNGMVPDSVSKFILHFTEQEAGEGNPRMQDDGPPQEGYPPVQAAPDWLPKDFKGGCLIQFSSKRKTFVIEVGDFRVLPRQLLP